MENPDRRSHSAVFLTLLACGIGWFLLPYAPANIPGQAPGHLATIKPLVAWWPAALVAAFAIGLTLPKMAPGSGARWPLIALQWLLTYASVALIVAIMLEVFLPRPG